jgi:hypothetical protein
MSFRLKIVPGSAVRTSLTDVAATVLRLLTWEPRPTSAQARPGDRSEHASIAQELHCPLTFAGAHGRRNRPISPRCSYHDGEPFHDAVSHCLLYDGPGPDARLIGIEYLVSDEVYRQMPAEEKIYWHDHRCEADASLPTSLTESGSEERSTHTQIRHLWGKVYRTWVAGGDYPRGPARPFWSDTGELPFVLPPGAEAQLSIP